MSSIDATASRDEALDFAYLLSRIAVHLSRLAEQWIIYSTTEFGFIRLGSAFTTGSSMMPQKRNPDMLELIRGRSANVIGALMGLLTMCKGLPLAYNRDLQEDKRLLFAAYDTALDCIIMAARIVASAEFDRSRIDAAGGGLDRGYLDATALAEHLVLKGVPFRTAHQVVGALVRECEATGRHALSQLKVEEFVRPCGDRPGRLPRLAGGRHNTQGVVRGSADLGGAVREPRWEGRR
jgi:argininosuccinate lyase